MKSNIIASFFTVLVSFGVFSQNVESSYYSIQNVSVPQDVILEGGGVCTLPNGSIAVSTRRGDIYIIENPSSARPIVRKFAEGLHEILGLRYFNDSFYCAQRSELTRVRDNNGDGKADVYETVASWDLTGNYHEYSFGPVIDAEGFMYITANVGFFDPDWWRGRSKAKWRGWTLRIDPKTGNIEPWATGMRSPAGIGIIDGKFFYADNQGDWHGSGGLIHVEKGDFTGHPGGLAWSGDVQSPVKLTEKDIYSRVNPRFDDGTGRIAKPENIEGEKVITFYDLSKELDGVKPPAVWLPHGVLGVSTSEIIQIPEEVNFGPFGGQILIGDQGQSKISRVFLEQVNGIYQGGAILFREGFKSGVLRMTFSGDHLYVGQTNRGWGSTGPEPYALERLIWTGNTPFEIKRIKARPDGYEIEFTKPVSKSTAADLNNYEVNGFIYKYHPVYGSPAVNQMKHGIKGIKLSEDLLSVRIVLDSLREGYINEFILGVKSEEGESLLHETAYYTLNTIPEGLKLNSSELILPVLKETETVKKESKTEQKKTVPVKKTVEVKPVKIAKRTTILPSSWGKVDRTLSVTTKPGLKFSVETITVKAGEKIKLQFSNPDDMPHNLLIVKKGTANDVGIAAIKLGVNGLSKDYVPDSDNVLFHTKLLQPGTSDTIFIEIPADVEELTFVCTYPGHYLSMQGTIRIQKQ